MAYDEHYQQVKLARDKTSSKNLNAVNERLVTELGEGHRSCAYQITGTWVGTIQFQVSVNGTTFVPMMFTDMDGFLTNSTNTNGVFICNVGALVRCRAIMIAYTSGIAVVTSNHSYG